MDMSKIRDIMEVIMQQKCKWAEHIARITDGAIGCLIGAQSHKM